MPPPYGLGIRVEPSEAPKLRRRAGRASEQSLPETLTKMIQVAGHRPVPGGGNWRPLEATSRVSRSSVGAPRLKSELGVAALYVFGSVARGEASADSDVDMLVEFDGPATFARFMDLKALLEDSLGARVDLVTRAALRTPSKRRIEAEARRVA